MIRILFTVIKKAIIILILINFTSLVKAETIIPQNIIKFFDICKINSSLGQMCKMDSFNSYDYFKGLDEVITDNVAHYKEGDFWEFFFTIKEQDENEATNEGGLSEVDICIKGEVMKMTEKRAKKIFLV